MPEVQVERDWPIGHPKAVDYNGAPYKPTPPPLARDWPAGHPKAADDPRNIAESSARLVECTAPGAPGIPLESAAAEAGELAAVIAAGKHTLTSGS